MTSLEDVAAYRRVAQRVSAAAVLDVRRLVQRVRGADPYEGRDLLIRSVPRIVDSGAATMGTFASSWAAELFAAQGLRFTPAGLPLPNPVAIESSIRWAVGPMFGNGTGTVADNLSGVVERMIADAGRMAVADDWGGLRTAWHRRTSQQIKTGDFRSAAFQRIPTPGCCDYCSMLASRGAVYWTEAAGEAGGHDRCYCVIAPVFRADSWSRDVASRYMDRHEGRLSRDDDAQLPEDATAEAVRVFLTN